MGEPVRLEPIYDRLLVEPISEGRLSPGGIAIPDVAAASRPYAYGEVIAAGSGRVNLEGKVAPLAVKTGDVVMFPRRSGMRVPLLDDDGAPQRTDDGSDRELLLMREPDVLCVVHDFPRATRITGVDGRLLRMVPTSKGLPDSVYKNREEMDAAERAGFADPADHVDEWEPGDAPDDVTS